MISLFPCLSDNYGFLLHVPESGLTAAIDTPDADEIARQCDKQGWRLTHIFNTHHHYDHTGGNLALKDTYGVEIFGPKAEGARIPGLDRALNDGEVFDFGGHAIHFLHTPGHTLGHGAYYVPDEGSVFVGDTLFIMGCGRLFEGSAEQMYDSLHRLAALPAATKVYCAHEYTLSNGRFALSVEPDNEDLQAAIRAAQSLRDQGRPTVPGTIGQELKTNPFMRAESPEELARIRAAKDRF